MYFEIFKGLDLFIPKFRCSVFLSNNISDKCDFFHLKLIYDAIKIFAIYF